MREVIMKVALPAALALGLQIPAQAMSLGMISGTATMKNTNASGSFLDVYDFTVGTNSDAGVAATSVSFPTYGTTVTTLALYEGNFTSAAQLVGLTPVSANAITTITQSGAASITTLASSARLDPITSYTLAIGGTSINSAGYTGIIALVDTIRVLPAVPEPETYAMLLAGLGMMGMIARRRKISR